MRYGERGGGYERDSKWALEMQPIAISRFYNAIWSGWQVVELDNDRRDVLKIMLDIGGADKMLRAPDGHIEFLAQRFRRYRSWHPNPNIEFDDATIRYDRPSGTSTEMQKLKQAFEAGGFMAGWYAFGHANKNDTDFEKFRVINLKKLLGLYYSGCLTYRIIPNHDGSSRFAAIPFSRIPEDLFKFNSQNSYRISLFGGFL